MAASTQVDPKAALIALKTHYATLMLMIRDSLVLAGRLHSKGVVSTLLMSKVTALGLSSHEKNILILNEVEEQIPSNPNVFGDFLHELLSIKQLREMGIELQKSYVAAVEKVVLPATKTNLLDEYAKFLKGYYTKASVSPDYKWPRTPSTQYVNLAIVKKERVNRAQANEFTLATLHGDIDQIMKVKEPIEFGDILKSDSSKKVRYVLVEGAPGVGKSTFAWELCKQWENIEALRKYTLVVIIRLRDMRVQSAKTLSDLFHHTDSDIQHAISQQVGKSEGEGVLLIMDGADEIPISIWMDETSIFAKIVDGSCLPKATLLVTSRPSAVIQILGLKEPDKHIEILGFSLQQIHEYAVSVFGSDTKPLHDFERYISSTPAIKGMLYIPLNTAIVVEVYQENKTKDRPIPNTLTCLYTDLCLLLLQRYLIAIKLVSASTLGDEISDLPQDIHHLFLNLAEIAFNGILKKQIVFQNFPEDIKGLGFTTASAELFTGRRVTHAFLHLTIQEFLAAYFIAQLPAEKQSKLFLDHSSKDHLDVVWRFFAGLTAFDKIGWEIAKSTYSCNIETQDTVMEISEGSTCLSLITLRCLFETQFKGSTTALASEEVIFTSGNSENFQPFDFFALGYCIAHSNQCCWKVIIRELNLQGDLMEMFTSGILSNPKLSSFLDTLCFKLTPLSKDGISYLKELPRVVLNRVHALSLDQCGLDSPALSCFSQLLPQMNNLEKFSFDLYTLDDTEKLLESLNMCPNLKFLQFPRGFRWSITDIKILEKLIAPGRTLSNLNVSCTALKREEIKILLNVLLSESSLHTLTIYGMKLALPGSHEKFSLLGKNSNLQTLKLNNCPLGNRGATKLAEALTVNGSLTCLELNGSHRINEDGGAALSQMLDRNDTINILKLSLDDNLGTMDSAAVKGAFPKFLAERPPPNNTLAVVYSRGNTIELSYYMKKQ